MVGSLMKMVFRFAKRITGNSLAVKVLPLFLVLCFSGMVQGATPENNRDPVKKDSSELSWELPGRVSIYDLQFGPADFKDNHWQFLGTTRTFKAGSFGKRLTLMIKFSYSGSKEDIPLKFLIRLPNTRQYEETIHLTSRRGNYVYKFTIHNPEDFLGNGSVYLYYGFNIVDVLDFTIVPGS
jgi:hypothetical protein